jgi:hypothetical protein
VSNIVGAIVLFGIGIYAAYVTHDDYQAGQVRILLARGEQSVFRRQDDPRWFLPVVAINFGVAAGFLVCGLLLLRLGLQE